jgi:hypothetical protein
MANWGKQTSSTINVGQPLSWAGTGTSFSTNFSAQTRQIRVISQINGWVAVLQSTATMFSTSTMLAANGGPAGTYIAANTANGDYWTVNPGQILGFTSTTTGTTGTIISCTELT